MKTKKSLMYLECINENLNTLILNQEMTYFIMQEILKKMGMTTISSPPLGRGGDEIVVRWSNTVWNKFINPKSKRALNKMRITGSE